MNKPNRSDVVAMDFVDFAKAFHGGAIPVEDHFKVTPALPKIPYVKHSYSYAESPYGAPGFLVVADDSGVRAYSRSVQGVGEVVAWADPDHGLVTAGPVPPEVVDEMAFLHVGRAEPTDKAIVTVGPYEMDRLLYAHRRAVETALSLRHRVPERVVQAFRDKTERSTLAKLAEAIQASPEPTPEDAAPGFGR